MLSIKQTQLKHDLHNELKIRYKEFFESKLAIELLKNVGDFTSVKKISNIILHLISTNKKQVVDLIFSNPRITNELREPYFGSFIENKEEITPEAVFEKICAVLKNGAELKSIMQIHCIFIYRIYDHLIKNEEKTVLVNKIFKNELLSAENRDRSEVKECKSTTQLGISRHAVFAKRLGQSVKKHKSAIDKFIPNYHAAFFKSAIEKSIPVVCGPSGHTGFLLIGAKLYGDLTADQLREYALVCFAFLAAGGNHSFHEVMSIMALTELDIHLDNYEKNFPTTIKNTDVYRKLSDYFPEFLGSEKTTHSTLTSTSSP